MFWRRILVFGFPFALVWLLFVFHQYSALPNVLRPKKLKENGCGVWSLPNLLLNSPRTYIDHSVHGDIVHMKWRHVRSGARYASGVMDATVKYCIRGGEAMRTMGKLEPQNALCRGNGAVVIQLREGTYDDLLSTARSGVNLWHFHAAVLHLWVTLRLVDAAAFDRTQKDGYMKPFTLRHVKRPVVIVLSAVLWKKLALPMRISFFQSTPEDLLLLRRKGAHQSALEGIQAIGEVLGGRVIVVRESITIETLDYAQKMAGFPNGIAAWALPPGDGNPNIWGFLWDIAHDDKLASKLTNCRRSYLKQYADEVIGAVVQGHARHVCLVSRQLRGRSGDTSRGKVRNLEHEFYARLILRLSAPIVLSPSLGLFGSNTTRVPMLLDSTSIIGQLRFVRRECAVLLGVHGAGLTNALGLQRGSAIIELMPPGPRLYYYRNVAALLTDVSYDMIDVDSTGSEKDVDLVLDDRRLEQLIDLVKLRLEQSIRYQQTMQASSESNHFPWQLWSKIWVSLTSSIR